MPTARPRGLQLVRFRHAWYRIDAVEPASWTWRAYPTPHSRFDSASGRWRVRYAGQTARVAMRERFDRDRRVVPTGALDAYLVELSGAVRVIDLRLDRTLDALGLDDQISTSRAPDVWAACQSLTDRVQDWFGERCDGIVYRSRTTPERSANIAFFQNAPLIARNLGTLRQQPTLLDSCVLNDGFEVMGWR